MNKVKILFINNLPTTKLINSSGGKIDSFYRSSAYLIEGLRLIPEVNIKVITSPDIKSFPHNKAYYKRMYDEIDDITMVSSLNISYVKQLWTIISMVVEGIKHIRNSKDVTYVIIPYMVFRHVMASRILKLICGKKMKGCIVIPDIFFPQNKIFKLVNKYTEKLACKNDFFILYTKAMGDYLKIQDKPYIVIEGFKKVDSLPIHSKDDKFIIMYAGSLTIKYGILRLVDAMNFISEKDIELHLYGDGDGVNDIIEASKNDDRIKYFGKVSKDEATKALYKSSVLVNPRSADDGEYVAYSFPSKDIDYLATGIPSILCKLPGMPQNYYGKFIDAGNGTSKEIAECVMKVYKMTEEERLDFGKNAFDFIKQQMNPVDQANRIIKMFEK